MPAIARAVTVATTATRITATNPDSDGIAGSSGSLFNAGPTTVYLGGASVTTATGIPLAAGSYSDYQTVGTNADAIYGIVASGTQEIRVLELGVS